MLSYIVMTVAVVSSVGACSLRFAQTVVTVGSVLSIGMTQQVDPGLCSLQ